MNEELFILEEITTSSNEVFKDYESDITVGIWLLRDPTREAAESYVILRKNADFSILTRATREK